MMISKVANQIRETGVTLILNVETEIVIVDQKKIAIIIKGP